jgi:hypothetical protein
MKEMGNGEGGGRRKACLAAMLLLLCGGARAHAAVASLDDVRFWVGSGANRAGVVLDWNGDSAADAALAWGFRWDGTATGEEMVRAVIAADPRLFAKLGANGALGLAVRGLGYDLNDDGAFALDDGTTFDEVGVFSSGPTDGATSIDPADRYREGWFTGVWSYATADANPWPTAAWTFSRIGATSRTLVDGAWDSWAFTPTFRQSAFGANAAPAVQPADFDSDGDVDGSDFLRWQRGLGLDVGVSRSLGDASGDGLIDGADLLSWQSQFGAAPTPPTIQAPEPVTSTTCASAMLAVYVFVRQLSRNDS